MQGITLVNSFAFVLFRSSAGANVTGFLKPFSERTKSALYRG